MIEAIVFLLVWGVIAVLTAHIADAKNRDAMIWFLLGCTVGLIALVAIILLPAISKAKANPFQFHACPWCMSDVPNTARLCARCGKDQSAPPEEPVTPRVRKMY